MKTKRTPGVVLKKRRLNSVLDATDRATSRVKATQQRPKAKVTSQKRGETKKSVSVLAQLQRTKREKLWADDEQSDYHKLLCDVEKWEPDRKLDEKTQARLDEADEKRNTTRKAYAASLRKAIDEADVIIEVLDCRDPLGYRSIEIEDEIIQKNKKIILLLNKCDLIEDVEIIDKWLRYLRRHFPCVAFRSMTTQSRSANSSIDYSNYQVTTCPPKLLKSGYTPIGARQLMGILNNYARHDSGKCSREAASQDIEDDAMVDENESSQRASLTKAPAYKNIVVAVIGMPNVGKSSVINSLCRNSTKVKTGNEAGITRSVSRIRLSDHIQLLDTPGVIMNGSENDASAILRGCVKKYNDETAEQAADILRAIPSLVPQIGKLYGLTDQEVKEQSRAKLLSLIAQRKGLIKKRGVRDLSAAARLLVEDWRRGRLIAYAEPPAHEPGVELPQIAPVKAPALDLDAL